MKIAYIITAYKLPDLLVRLVQRLNTDETSFFIHVDKKTDSDIYQRMLEPFHAYTNVHFIERIVCNWGEFGQVRAPLNGIHAVLADDIKYDYAFSLTAQDYPIKSNRQIQEVLQNCAGRSFLNYLTFPHPEAEQKADWIAYWHIHMRRWSFVFPRRNMFPIHFLNRLWNPLVPRITLRRSIPGGLQPFFGGSHWCLSRDCLQYLQEFVQQNPAYGKFFSKYVHIPSEIFFQTILLNSPLKDRLVNDDLSYIDFSGKKNAHPAVLDKGDFEKFMRTGDLFARKFDPTIDGEVLDMIDAAIR